MRTIPRGACLCVLLAHASAAHGQAATPGYPEPILQWTVQRGETCTAIAEALYGHARHALVVGRYEKLDCSKPLPEGRTLVVPASLTDLPAARLRGVHPEVRERPAGGGWNRAAAGMPLFPNHSVNTLEDARADILFSDRTRVYLAEHTLVVIYGSAAQTRVHKTRPAHVELDQGELQAGLAALRGDTARVSVRGGAQVDARSRDTVVRKKQLRSTVSVFDGDAAVSSGGKRVAVQQRFGTSFVERKPPTPPRPLPPAPDWRGPVVDPVVLVPEGGGTISASWQSVPKAVSYRVELADDAEFAGVLLREEVPASVLAFRAERMPVGRYFLRVRAIDHEDFLGLASRARKVTLVATNLSAGALQHDTLEVHPYAELRLKPAPGVELSIDSGPFVAAPNTLDLARLRPAQLAFRGAPTGEAAQYRVKYQPVAARIDARSATAEGALRIVVELQGFEGVDVQRRVKPRLRVSASGQSWQTALVPEGRSDVLAARVTPPPGDQPVHFEVLDSRDRVLGESVLDRKPARAARPPEQEPAVAAPPISPSLATDVVWWSPAADRSAALSAVAGSEDRGARAQAHARAAAGVGDFGVDVRLASGDLAETGAADDAAWLGVRWRAAKLDELELGPALRAAVPTSDDGSPARADAGFAIGARQTSWSWLVNVGGRALMDESRHGVPDGQGYVLLGASVDAHDWVSVYGLLDAHGLVRDAGVDPRGGFALGLEMTTQLFAGACLRASPWDADGGHVFGQLALGVRESFAP